MVRIAICEDCSQDRVLINEYLNGYFKEVGKSFSGSEFKSGEALLAEYEDGRGAYDLIFMDVFMEAMSGIETAMNIRKYDKRVHMIFLTASPDFAVESYEVEAAGYLLKPLNMEKFKKIMNKLLGAINVPRLSVKSGAGHKYFGYDEIFYMESVGRSVIIHLRTGENFKFNEKLDNLEGRLSDKRFLRCHQSFLVNMDYIQKVEECFVMTDGSVVPMRVRERRELSDIYYKYFINNTFSKRGEI